MELTLSCIYASKYRENLHVRWDPETQHLLSPKRNSTRDRKLVYEELVTIEKLLEVFCFFHPRMPLPCPLPAIDIRFTDAQFKSTVSTFHGKMQQIYKMWIVTAD